jgi:hypothetical protein
LTILQQARVSKAKRELEQAEILRRADLATRRQTNLQEFGFDFSQSNELHTARQSLWDKCAQADARPPLPALLVMMVPGITSNNAPSRDGPKFAPPEFLPKGPAGKLEWRRSVSAKQVKPLIFDPTLKN